MDKATQIESILSKTTKVYFGKAHTCCCGCAGNYHTSPAMMNKAKAKIKANLEIASVSSDMVYVELDGRLCIAYTD